MIQVIKRDGEIADFNLGKITEAIKKAFKATKKDYNNEILELLSLRVTADFQNKMKDGKISVEQIQDSAEHVLDYKDVVNSYVKVEDWRVKENSTVTYSVGGLILSNSGAITANYWLSEIYDTEIAEAHRSGDLHLHDLSMLTGYCAGWSLKQLIMEGLGGIPGKITSSPARHLSGSEEMHRILYLWRQYPQPLGHPGSVLQHHPGLDGAGRYGQYAGYRRRKGNGLHLRRLQGGDGYDQPGLH